MKKICVGFILYILFTITVSAEQLDLSVIKNKWEYPNGYSIFALIFYKIGAENDNM